ncbi:MAG TPA: alpha/beta hydrolase [Nocardioidaceae bacterium]|nr:alpha/beta hydrolase [Nocardioidaceae bacterium]
MSYVTSGGLRLYYREVGEGPAILWHTGGCGDGSMWERAGYVEALPGYRHLLLDHRGHGLSEKPATLAEHTMANYVDDVVAVLDDAGVDRAVFVGYSLGARVGYAVALSQPARLTGLVALDSIRDPADTADGLRQGGDEVLTRGTVHVIEEMAGYESQPAPAWLIENLCATEPLQFAGAFEAHATEPDFWGRLADLTVPTLFLLAVDEHAHDPEDVEGSRRKQELAALAVQQLPRASVAVMSGVLHLGGFWRTDLSVPPIREFLCDSTLPQTEPR